jgi:hypothetical protein
LKLTKCANKHFYDADKYDRCPHCDGTAIIPDSVRIGSPMQRGGVEPETEKVRVPSRRGGADEGYPAEPQNGYAIRPPEPPQNAAASEPAPADIYAVAEPPARADAPPERGEPAVVAPVPKRAAPAAAESAPAAAGRVPSAPERGKTVAFYNFGGADPVVGWLVCVSGVYHGQSFTLKAGQNFVGRDERADVPLTLDERVSRGKHAIIMFEPKGRTFYVMAGDTNGLTYLNDELVLTPAKLAAYSKIGVGGSEFLFVPFCGTEFSWEGR